MNEETIFSEAIQIGDVKRREAFLDQACGDDATLRAGVNALLESHSEAESFLEQPALEGTRPTIVTLVSTGVTRTSSGPRSARTP